MHTIFRLYQLYSASGDWPSTPRSAKRFVNKLVATHHLWIDRIPLPIQALYVLLSGAEIDFSDAEALPQPVRYLVGEDWNKNLAGLYYGLEPEVALQVVVGPRLAEALERSDVAALVEDEGPPRICGLAGDGRHRER